MRDFCCPAAQVVALSNNNLWGEIPAGWAALESLQAGHARAQGQPAQQGNLAACAADC